MEPSADFEVGNYFNRGSTKSLTEAKTTPVVLVCIYNKNNTPITHDLLYNVFSACGKILRILIFEKVKVWKAFVEFSSTEEAIEAKRNLNDFQLFNDGTRMNIYFSSNDTVKFQNNNVGGIDYTQPQENNLAELKNGLQPTEVQTGGISQLEPPTSFQNVFSNGVPNFESFRERHNPSNIPNQTHSGQSKWAESEEESDEDFLRYLNERNIEKEPSRYESDSKQDLEDFEKEQLIRKVFDDAFSRNNQNISFDKPKQQSLKLHSQPYNGPSQPSMQSFGQNSLQNPNFLWPQNLSPNAGPPGLSNPQGSMQEPLHFPPKLSKLPPSNSCTHIPLRHNDSPYNTPPLSKNSTFTDLPNPNAVNSGSFNIGMLPPRHQTMQDLPKILPKPSLPQFGSMNLLPATKTTGHGPSSFSTLGGGGMTQMGSMNQIGGMNQGGMNQGQGQIKKPLLNPRFISQPELPMSSEINKLRINNMSSQNVQDLIEGDILLRLMMNRIQNQEGADLSQQNPVQLDLNEIKNSDLIYKGLGGNIDYNDLSQMSKETLDKIYENLSTILHKGVENKECAVLYVKGLEDENIKVQMLYNIFSNFGNIKKIIFIRRQAAALIEYESVEYATKAKDYLNNIVFMGKPLRIYYSFHPIINLKNKKTGKDSNEEIFLGTPKTFRFKKTKNISMNPPSSTLHISNLIKEMCSEDIIRKTFSQFGRIEAIQFKFMDNNRNMCLIRMASMEESLNAMAHLHDVDLGGRPIQISFTKSKI